MGKASSTRRKACSAPRKKKATRGNPIRSNESKSSLSSSSSRDLFFEDIRLSHTGVGEQLLDLSRDESQLRVIQDPISTRSSFDETIRCYQQDLLSLQRELFTPLENHERLSKGKRLLGSISETTSSYSRAKPWTLRCPDLPDADRAKDTHSHTHAHALLGLWTPLTCQLNESSPELKKKRHCNIQKDGRKKNRCEQEVVCWRPDPIKEALGSLWDSSEDDEYQQSIEHQETVLYCLNQESDFSSSSTPVSNENETEDEE